MRIKGGHGAAGEEEEARRIKWEELCHVMLELERRYGWEPMDGTTHYTFHEHGDQNSMVLGEWLSKRLVQTRRKGDGCDAQMNLGTGDIFTWSPLLIPCRGRI